MNPKYKNLHAPTATIDRLAEMAKQNGTTPPQMLAKLLDLAEAFPQLDTLPRPEGAQIVPVEDRHD